MICLIEVTLSLPRISLITEAGQILETIFFKEKVSEHFHKSLYDLIKKYKNITFIFSQGPGSYTGLRLIELFSFFLQIHHYKAYPFYYFEIPQWLQAEGSFISYAYKQESFTYSWLNSESIMNLLPYEHKSYENFFILPGEEHRYTNGKIITLDMIIQSLPEIQRTSRQLKSFYYRNESYEFKIPISKS